MDAFVKENFKEIFRLLKIESDYVYGNVCKRNFFVICDIFFRI